MDKNSTINKLYFLEMEIMEQLDEEYRNKFDEYHDLLIEIVKLS